MEHADRFLRRFYIEKGMFGSLSLTFFFYRPPLVLAPFAPSLAVEMPMPKLTVQTEK